ncbi:hypothetical protein GQ600_662 [Phytophthora cactorum]|nr:hypothetical protein GQ600_662 [Phytophthora cactorum]
MKLSSAPRVACSGFKCVVLQSLLRGLLATGNQLSREKIDRGGQHFGQMSPQHLAHLDFDYAVFEGINALFTMVYSVAILKKVEGGERQFCSR